MLHTHDDFLKAIAANPADRTLRLVFADWLDEHTDPRAELIRVEEEMRELPVFADRFWELKPRRNALRTLAGTEWCGQMRYGTECEPVFRHGIPDGWRERWRLIREFTERWHRVLLGDVGGRQAEIAEAEEDLRRSCERRSAQRSRTSPSQKVAKAEEGLGRTLPPSVREWVAFGVDVRSHEPMSVFDDTGACMNDIGSGVCLFSQGSGSLGFWFDVRFDYFSQPDPPVVLSADYGTYDDPAEATNAVWGDYPVTQLALWLVINTSSSANHVARTLPEPDFSQLRSKIEEVFPITTRWGHLSLHESDDVFVAFGWPLLGSASSVWVKWTPGLAVEALPAILQEVIRRPTNSNDTHS